MIFFLPGQLDTVFTYWRDNGLSLVKNFHVEGELATFEYLYKTFDLSQSYIFRYLQVHHFIKHSFPQLQKLPLDHDIHRLLRQSPLEKHLVSKFISMFVSHSSISTAHLKDAWERDLGKDIWASTWEEGLRRIHSCSINVRLQLAQFKVMHRLHYTKAKLNRLYPSISPLCDRCKSADGTYGHIFWSCPEVSEFWKGVFRLYSHTFENEINVDADLAIFGCSDQALTWPQNQQLSLVFGMVLAKRMILMEWKSTLPPSFFKWLAEMVSALKLERLRFSRAGRLKMFDKIWGPFLRSIF